MNSIVSELLLAGVLIGSLLIAFVIGARVGHVGDDEQQQMGVIQGATLGLIGLFVGFCFSGATSRFVERQDILVREGNALGTAWLRADLLAPTERTQLRTLLREYAQERIRLAESSEAATDAASMTKLTAFQKQLWDVAIQGVDARPNAALLVLPAMNDVYDLLSTRNAAAMRHIPKFALVLMFLTILMGAAVLGYGQRGKRPAVRFAALAVVVLIGMMAWVTLDLDFPQRGLIQISDAPLRWALDGMKTGE